MKNYQFPENKLNINAICRNTKALGPGNRYVIWTQGCMQKCKSCATPEGIELKDNILILPEVLALDIIETPNIQGITISGGEPFLQAKNLVTMLRLVLKEKPLGIIIYTGYLYENLIKSNDPYILELIKIVDVIIDGLYIDELNDDKGLRGSSNQKINYITDRYTGMKDYFESKVREVELRNDIVIGIKPKGLDEFFAKEIINKLYKKH